MRYPITVKTAKIRTAEEKIILVSGVDQCIPGITSLTKAQT